MVIKKIYDFTPAQKDMVYAELLHIQKQQHLMDFVIYVDDFTDSVVVTATRKAWTKWRESPCYPDSLYRLISKLEFWQEICYPS